MLMLQDKKKGFSTPQGIEFFSFPLQKNNKENMGKSQWKNENEC
jgi:hypothetical protein